MTKADLNRLYGLWRLGHVHNLEIIEAVGAFVGAETIRCPLCHGKGTVNFEQAAGWDEPCEQCKGTGEMPR